MVGGLKDALKQRAAKAVAVVAGALVPGLLAQAQDAKDEREGRSAFRQAIYRAASEKAAANPELVDRLVDRLVHEEFGKQERREAVVLQAIEHLQEDVPEQPSDVSEEVSEDWLNIFTSYAEKASSEQLQDMWGRVLAGEIRKPGSVSLKTLQAVSVLDKETAEAALAAFPYMINGIGLWTKAVKDLSLPLRRLLVDSYILRSSEHDTDTKVDDRFPGVWFCRFKKIAVVVERDQGSLFQYGLASATKIGSELSQIVPYDDKLDVIMAFAEHCKSNSHVNRVRVGPFYLADSKYFLPGHSLMMNWSRPTTV